MNRVVANVRFYILSKLYKHALAVIDETASSLRVQKIKAITVVNAFSGNDEIILVFDENHPATTEYKDHLSTVFSDVEITADYWTVHEYFTGKKRKAVAESTES